MAGIEFVLTECIQDIKTGKITLSECLERYATKYPEIRSLLELAAGIRQTPQARFKDSEKNRVKARMMQEIIHISENQFASRKLNTFSFWRHTVWVRVVAIALAVCLLLTGSTAGTVYAAQHSLPGDVIYPVKTGIESLRLAFAPDAATRTDLNMQFAQRRLEEMNQVAHVNQQSTQTALEGYTGNVDAAIQQLSGISTPVVYSDSLETLLNELKKQMTFCDGIVDTDPAYAEAVHDALALTLQQQIRLLTMLEEQNRVRAAEFNVEIMQNRLQRAYEALSRNQFQVMEEALQQYQQMNQFGMQIQERARVASTDFTAVEALNSEALAGYSQILAEMAIDVPPQYLNTVQVTQMLTFQFQAQTSSQYQGGTEGSPAPPQNGTNNATTQPEPGAADTGTGTPAPSGSAPPDSPGSGTPTPSSTGTGSGESPGKPVDTPDSSGGNGTAPPTTAPAPGGEPSGNPPNNPEPPSGNGGDGSKGKQG